jgi:spore maturation protein CgeB
MNSPNAGMKFVFCGLALSSSWGNGHATTYRALLRELHRRGHEVVFLERNRPWYAENRDLPEPHFAQLHFYSSLEEFKDRFASLLLEADAVILGSFVPEGRALGEWITTHTSGLPVFYDIDTPVTISRLLRGPHETSPDEDYLSIELIHRYPLYLSFTGGPLLRYVEEKLGSPKARPLYCSVDIADYYPESTPRKWDLGYLGTYSQDRQEGVERLLLGVAENHPSGQFVLAGSQYPSSIRYPTNVEYIQHLPPRSHRHFYNSQKFTLNLTREDMKRAGYSPSVRLFEAAACATPMISDRWEGIEEIFEPGQEVLLVSEPREVLQILRTMPENKRIELGLKARQRVLKKHTSALRAAEFEYHVVQTIGELRGQRWLNGIRPDFSYQ